MLSHRVLSRNDVGRAASYYEDSADDYYAKEGDATNWMGKGAEALGLQGPVASDRFRDLLAGYITSEQGVRMSTRQDMNNRIGIDLTFSAPKSVSLQALVYGDPEIIRAHDRAVAKAVAAAEKSAMARRKSRGVTEVERTGNLVVATFRHETSREKDPQLHTHAIVMNLTCRRDGEWRALKNDGIVKMTRYLGAVYNAELAKELQALGYTLRQERNGNFDLAHISREQLRQFSRRSEQIEAALAEQGLTRETATPEQKQQAALATRAQKGAADKDGIFAHWQARARELGINFTERSWAGAGEPVGETASVRELGWDNVPEAEAARRSVRFAINHLTERESIVRESRVLDVAIKHGMGTTTLSEIEEALRQEVRSGFLLKEEPLFRPVADSFDAPAKTRAELVVAAVTKGTDKADAVRLIDRDIRVGRLMVAEPRYTTQTAKEREARILSIERDGRGAVASVAANEWVAARLDQDSPPSITTTQSLESIQREWQAAFSRPCEVELNGDWAEEITASLAPHGEQRAALNFEACSTDLPVSGGGSYGSLEGPPMSDPDRIVKTHTSGLTPGQRDAAQLILTSPDRVVGIQGLAGTGKSYMLQTVRGLLDDKGYVMKALAPYASQVKSLREIGIQANTVASFLRGKNQSLEANTVLVVDESGVVPTRLMERVLRLAEKSGARVVLLGDTGQTKAIEAGRPFEQLQSRGMDTTLMGEIQRQKDPRLKAAVEMAASGRAAASLSLISAVVEIKGDTARRSKIAGDYASLSEPERNRALIVCGTNDGRREINELVRERLGVKGQGMDVDILVRRDTTQAERRFSRNFDVGDYVQPERDYPKAGLRRGVLYRVEDTGPGNTLTVRANGETDFVRFSPLVHSRLSVYAMERVELSKGDVVRWTRNDAARDLANGDRFVVQHIDRAAKRIVLASQHRRLETDAGRPLHVEHAYATTVHSAQGLTCDRVFIDLKTKSKTTAKDVYYVAVSRPRHRVDIYTDNRADLPAAISRTPEKTAALDLHHKSIERPIIGAERRPVAREVDRRG